MSRGTIRRLRRELGIKIDAGNVWFYRDSLPVWKEVLLPLREEINTYLEIGVCEGASMDWAIRNLEITQAFGIDPWVVPRPAMAERVAEQRARAYANLQPHMDSGVLTLIQGYSQSTLKMWDVNGPPFSLDRLDLIYVDGDHRGREAMEDMVLSWPFLRRGGMMVLDDYNKRWQRGRPWSYEAINGFLMAYECRYEEIHRDPQRIIIRKTKE